MDVHRYNNIEGSTCRTFLRADRINHVHAHIQHTLTRPFLADSRMNKRYEQTVRIWEEHLNRPENTKGSRDLAWFHVRYLSSRSSEVFELVTWGSRVPVKFVNRVQMTRFPGGIGFPLTFAGAHRVKEPGQRPSNQTLYRRLSFTTRVEEIFGDKRILELRGVSPTAARVKPGASSGFCDDWTVRTLTPTWGMPQHRAVDSCGASAMLDTFKSDPWVSNVCHNWFPVLPSQ